MTNWDSPPDPAPKPALLQTPAQAKARGGRPVGARNYGSTSFIARCMKERGISWVNELIEAYMLYKAQMRAGGTPDPSLLYFWQEVLPYITVKMIDKETRGKRPRRLSKRRISTSALDALVKAEGRKPV